MCDAREEIGCRRARNMLSMSDMKQFEEQRTIFIRGSYFIWRFRSFQSEGAAPSPSGKFKLTTCASHSNRSGFLKIFSKYTTHMYLNHAYRFFKNLTTAIRLFISYAHTCKRGQLVVPRPLFLHFPAGDRQGSGRADKKTHSPLHLKRNVHRRSDQATTVLGPKL